MSKFRNLIRTSLKEWNYPDNLDSSILDGSLTDNYDWLEKQYAIKIVGGIDNEGETLGEYPLYVSYDKETKQLDMTEDLQADSNSVDIKTNTYKRTSYSTFITKDEADKIANQFKLEYPNVELQIITVFGYGDNNPYYEKAEQAFDAYISDYEEDMATSGADDYYGD